MRRKLRGPSIRDGPEAIARMIGRTRNPDSTATGGQSPQGAKSPQGVKGETVEETEGQELSYR